MRALTESLLTVYTEERTPIHDEITENQVKLIIQLVKPTFAPNAPIILDVGCGMGVAWKYFNNETACYLTAITPNPEEILNCKKNDVTWVGSVPAEAIVNKGSMDLIWCRHMLEHSISPFADCLHFRDFLADDGLLYVEVPAPNTACGHEYNPNHYSVLGDRMWRSLFEKAGFKLKDSGVIGLKLEAGDDEYFWYILEKKKDL